MSRSTGETTKRILRHELLTLTEAVEELHLSRWTLRRWIEQGRLRAVRLGKRVLVPASEVDRLVREGSIGAAS